MKIFGKRGGFSLIELLTVIAIIAILAAIIFPVMGVVRQRANVTKCMSQMKEIAMAVKMYKSQERVYPELLGARVQFDPGAPANALQMSSTKGEEGLFPRYSSNASLFHCPSSKISNDLDLVSYVKDPQSASPTVVQTYAYNSYDCYIPDNISAVPGGPNYKTYDVSGDYRNTRYARSWAPSIAEVTNIPKDPGDTTSGPIADQRDYERQLRFRNPPDTTVITWCTNHVPTTRKAIVVFLDGHADEVNANVTDSLWRMLPGK